MNNKIIILLPMMTAFIYSVRAQQLQFGDNSDRLWFLSIPEFRSSSAAPCSTRTGRPIGIRDDYEYTTGIGAHKVHRHPATSWNQARRFCEEEGGYLTIINSVAEANVIRDHLAKIGTIRDTSTNYVYIGFHDLFEQGDYVTVHDQSLQKAGFTEWAAGQPNNGPGGLERCGSVYKDGRLNDISCNAKRIFICELSI